MPTTSPRAVQWQSRAAWTGASGRKTAVKRQSVEIIANSVQFLGSRDGSGGGGGNEGGGFSPSSDVPADSSDFAGAAAGGGGDDDIPF